MFSESLKALLMVNPTASSVDLLVPVDAVAERCVAFGLQPELVYTTQSRSTVALVSSRVASAMLSDCPYRLVVAVGGDGTACQVAEGIVRGVGRWTKDKEQVAQPRLDNQSFVSPMLMVLPGGTGNSTYKALWEDAPWESAMDAACAYLVASVSNSSNSDSNSEGSATDSGVESSNPSNQDDSDTPRRSSTYQDKSLGSLADRSSSLPLAAEELKATLARVDLGHMRSLDSASLLGVSVGFLAEVVSEAATLKEVKGRERYEQAAQHALHTHRSFGGEVKVDGRKLASGQIDLVAIGGAPHRGGVLNILPHSVLDDGLLDVCVLYDLPVGGLVQVLLEAMRGNHLGLPGVAYAQGRTVHVSSEAHQPLLIEHDGDNDDIGVNELIVDVLAGALDVLRKQ